MSISSQKVAPQYARLRGKRGNRGSAKVGSWHRTAKQKRQFPHGISQTIHICDYETKEVIPKPPLLVNNRGFSQDYNYKVADRVPYPVALTSNRPDDLAIMTLNLSALSKNTWDPGRQALGTTLYKHGTVQQALWDMSKDITFSTVVPTGACHVGLPAKTADTAGAAQYPQGYEWAPGCAQGIIGANNSNSSYGFKTGSEPGWAPNELKIPNVYEIDPDGTGQNHYHVKFPTQDDGLLFFSNSTCWNTPNRLPKPYVHKGVPTLPGPQATDPAAASATVDPKNDTTDSTGSVLMAQFACQKAVDALISASFYDQHKITARNWHEAQLFQWPNSGTGSGILSGKVPTMQFCNLRNVEGMRHPAPLNYTAYHPSNIVHPSAELSSWFLPPPKSQSLGYTDIAAMHRPYAPNCTLAPSTCFVTTTKYPHALEDMDTVITTASTDSNTNPVQPLTRALETNPKTGIIPPHYLRGLTINLKFIHHLPVAQRITVKVVRMIDETPVRPGHVASMPDTPGRRSLDDIPMVMKANTTSGEFELDGVKTTTRAQPEAYNEYDYTGVTPHTDDTPTRYSSTIAGPDGYTDEANVKAIRTMVNRQSTTNGARWETIWSTSKVLGGCNPHHDTSHKTWTCKKTLKMNYKKTMNRVFTDSTDTHSLGTGATTGFEIDETVRFFNNVHVVVTAKVLNTEYQTRARVPTKQVRITAPGTARTDSNDYDTKVAYGKLPDVISTYNNQSALVTVDTTAKLQYPNDFMIKGLEPDRITDLAYTEGAPLHAGLAPYETARPGAYTGVKNPPGLNTAVQGDRADVEGADPNQMDSYPKKFLSSIGLSAWGINEMGGMGGSNTGSTVSHGYPYNDISEPDNPFNPDAQFDRSMYRGACVQLEGSVKVYHAVEEATPLHGLVTNKLSLLNRISSLEKYINQSIQSAVDDHEHVMYDHGHGNDDNPHWHTNGNQSPNASDAHSESTSHHHDSHHSDSPDEEGSDNEESEDDGPTSGHHNGEPPPTDGHTHPNSLTAEEHEALPAHSH